jgi:hypothetical protein
MKQAGTLQSQLRMFKAFSLFSKQSVGGHFTVLQANFGMTAQVKGLDRRDVSHDVKSGLLDIDQKQGGTYFGARHDDGEISH